MSEKDCCIRPSVASIIDGLKFTTYYDGGKQSPIRTEPLPVLVVDNKEGAYYFGDLWRLPGYSAAITKAYIIQGVIDQYTSWGETPVIIGEKLYPAGTGFDRWMDTSDPYKIAFRTNPGEPTTDYYLIDVDGNAIAW